MPLDPHSLGLRFWSNVNFLAPGGCWEWNGRRNNMGYGVSSANGKNAYAHRMSLSAATGLSLRDELKALHSCDNPPCVNPAHLSWGTQRENLRDMARKGRASKGSARRTHCRRGHPMADPNLIHKKNGSRQCRTCHQEAQRRRVR